MTKYTAIYGVYIRFWPTLDMRYREEKKGKRMQV